MQGDWPRLVLIHDAARPILPRAVIDRLVDALEHFPGAIPVLPVVDSLCHAESDPRGVKMGAPARREALRRVQTPQAFNYNDILAAHQAGRTRPSPATMPRWRRPMGSTWRWSMEMRSCTN
jgi:2-C-methyl-D-erythritol 4-phosphate cytidylyltransferase/2-C-methyl-D-erythritol 2,4-cyclodiphosphate synthase